MAGRGFLFAASSGDAAGENLDSVLLQGPRVPPCEPLGSIFMPGGGSSSFVGSTSMVSFKDVNGRSRSEMPFFCSFDQDENGDDDLDEYFQKPEKKRRLTVDQVQFLEKSFEAENKLEPERKVQLAKELSLQPRQVAIWFQNRRARWKTKQLEKDYESLHARYCNLKSDYETCLKEKDKLRAEVLNLTGKIKEKEKGTGLSETKSLSSEPLSTETTVDSLLSEGEMSKNSTAAYKKEDNSPAKSDVFDTDSPDYTEGGSQSSLVEPAAADSSYVFELEHSDLSQDEKEEFGKEFLPFQASYGFPKVEDTEFPSSTPASSYFFAFPVEDQTSCFWSY